MKIIKGFFKLVFILFLLLVLLFVGTNFYQSYKDKNPDDIDKITFPTEGVGSLLPTLTSAKGSVSSENNDYYSVDIYKISLKEYKAYVEECKEKGFNVDYDYSDSSYTADDNSKHHLSISYWDKYERMDITIEAVEDEPAEASTTAVESETTEAPTPEAEVTTANTEEVSPEFKEAMDSYEAFFNEYVDFMKKYSESGNAASMLQDYTSYLTRYADTMGKLDEINEDELSGADLQYYIEVHGRIMTKLAEVAGTVAQ